MTHNGKLCMCGRCLKAVGNGSAEGCGACAQACVYGLIEVFNVEYVSTKFGQEAIVS